MTFVFVPPPVRGIGSQSGFAMRLQDRGNFGAGGACRYRQELRARPTPTP